MKSMSNRQSMAKIEREPAPRAGIEADLCDFSPEAFNFPYPAHALPLTENGFLPKTSGVAPRNAVIIMLEWSR